MRISDIFRQQPLERTDRPEESTQTQKRREREQLERGVTTSYGEDTITISSVSRQLAQISRIVADDEISSQNQVAALKDEIEKGTYAVTSEDIAKSLVSYLRSSEE